MYSQTMHKETCDYGYYRVVSESKRGPIICDLCRKARMPGEKVHFWYCPRHWVEVFKRWTNG